MPEKDPQHFAWESLKAYIEQSIDEYGLSYQDAVSVWLTGIDEYQTTGTRPSTLARQAIKKLKYFQDGLENIYNRRATQGTDAEKLRFCLIHSKGLLEDGASMPPVFEEKQKENGR